MAPSDVPLLNHYKKQFVLNRLPQTLLGGISLRLGYSAPWYTYACKVILWLMPWIIGGAFTLAVEVGGLLPLHACIGNGLIVGVLVLLLQIGSQVMSGRQSESGMDKQSLTSHISAESKHLKRLLAEEDEVMFDSFCSFQTFLFVIPPKRYVASIALNSVVSSYVCGLGMWYCLPYTTLTLLHGYSTVGSIFLFIFSWIVICIAHYPLINGTPTPETAAYRSVDIYDTQNMSRALFVSLFLCVFMVELITASSLLTATNSVLNIVFCTLPLLWLLGIIPPFDALLLWAMEQFLVFGLGGSCMATDWRLLTMFVLSSAALVGGSFITSTQALVSFCVAVGYFLSTDFTSVFMFALMQCVVRLKRCCRKSKTQVVGYEDYSEGNEQKGERSLHDITSWKSAVWHFVMFSLAFVAAFLSHYYVSSISDTVSIRLGMNYAFIGIFVLVMLCRDIQKVYIIFGIFRNCLYPLSTLSRVQFLKRKKLLKILGLLGGSLMHFIFPLLATVYLSFFLFSTTISLPSFEAAIGCLHGMRCVWQRPGHAVFVFATFAILDVVPVVTESPWGTLYVGTRLIILDLCRDRLFQFVENSWFAVNLIVTSWTDKKQRRSWSVVLLCLNVILFPVTLIIIATASVLSAPLLPLFTLPLFMVGFPRTSKFWPSQPGSIQANVCPDTMYYTQLAGPVSRWFSSQVGLGVFGVQSSFSHLSSFYIARTQDRTLWIQVLESGCGYTSFSMKGLELQETSCHSLEATRLDDSFDIAFEKTELDLRCLRTNQYMGSSVTPVDSAFIDSYSDAKNSLAGIIDQPNVLRQIRSDFLKALAWLLVHKILSAAKGIKDKTDSTQTRRLVQTPVQPLKDVVTDILGNDEEDTVVPNAVPDSSGSVKRTTTLHSLRSDSLVSFTSLLSTDDEGNVKKTKSKTGDDIELAIRRASRVSSRGGSKRGRRSQTRAGAESADSDIHSILSDSGYGLPAVEADAMIRVGKNQAVVHKSSLGYSINGLRESYLHLNGAANNADGDEKLFYQLVPAKWNEVPLSKEDIAPSRPVFDAEWLEHCFKSVTEKLGLALKPTYSVLTTLTNLVLACDVITNVMGVPGKDSEMLGTEHLHQVYSGNIPWSPALDWLLERKDLHDIVITAYRYAVKLMYDQASLGEVENHDELAEYFTEYDTDWFVGTESDSLWKQNIADGTPNLFSLSLDRSKKESSARVLSKQAVSLHAGQVRPAVVKGIWANFALELIYATNDDEERYSIQAHLSFLRNLILQAADPPLGYPIFSSQPISVSTLPFT